MTPRGRHLIEMRFALANDCTLAEAKRRLARQAALEARDAAALRSQCGTDYTRARSVDRSINPSTGSALTVFDDAKGQTPPRWMMAD